MNQLAYLWHPLRRLSTNRLSARRLRSQLPRKFCTMSVNVPGSGRTIDQTMTEDTTLALEYRYIDIGVNLTDSVFRGRNRGWGSKVIHHEDDFDLVIGRSKQAGVESMIVTCGSLRESKEVLKLAKDHNLYATLGCHPTRSGDFDKFEGGPETYLHCIDETISRHLEGPGRIVAVGECGLDYDRLHFADKETQKKHFRSQLSLAKKYHLPLFLHSRAAAQDLSIILREEGFGEDGGKAVGGRGGVVHSFTGTVEEMRELHEMGFYFSVNGCSTKAADQLETIKQIPLERLMLETDAPWCSMKPSHASKMHLDTLPPALRCKYFPPAVKGENFEIGKAVKDRNEPCSVGGVAWVVSRLHGVPFEDVVDKCWNNTVEVFGLHELA
ncbi:hypothetical protein SCHPADRAFT_918156 [Schizopora paradoxa]|uniref:Mg-dependent DNase n=1 Tax=Schizopora paradoxa TaxID=27342 RepID=A0A0H2S8Z3_9AGAM|nr:hypothetical protein SCHPADRAFT_918156 [Schizopora paradoxa]